MADFRALMIARAKRVIPGPDYNQVRHDMYEETRPLFYELVLPEHESWEQFRDRNYPAYIRYLRTKFVDPLATGGVVVAAFFKEHCYLMDGRDFMDALAEMEELDEAALDLKVREWRSGR